MATPVPAPTVVVQAAPVVVPPVQVSTGFVQIFGVSVYPSAVMLTMVALVVLYMLWRSQKSLKDFDVFDLLMDTLSDGTRRVSGIKSVFVASFVISSWVIVDQEIKGTLNAEMFFAYLSVWAASAIAKVVWDTKQAPQSVMEGLMKKAGWCPPGEKDRPPNG